MYLAASLIAITPILCSIVAQTLRKTVEYGQPAAEWQSWAALYGDNITLPIGLFAATVVLWGDLPGRGWLLVSIAITLVIAVIARTMDRNGFTKSGNGDRLYSPTKLWHDFVTWPVVGTPIFMLVAPAALTGTFGGYVALGGVVLWVLFVIRDILVGLDPAMMHPRWQDTAIAPLVHKLRLS